MPVTSKPKAERELRMNWAGFFPHPTEDVDIFNKLPAWRQAQSRETREILDQYPFARTFKIISPATGTYKNGQYLIEDIVQARRAQRQNLPEVPAGYKFDVPNGAPRGLFAYGFAPAPTEQQAHRLLLLLESHVTQSLLMEACTSERQLLNDKPLDGVYAFIWRLARYMSGLDASIAATAFVDLIDGISCLSTFRVDPWKVKTIMKFLEGQAALLVDSIGGNKHAGNLRWAQTTGLAR